MSKNRFLALNACAALLLLAGLGACGKVNEGSLVFTNALAQPIESGTVTLGKQSVALAALAPQQSQTLSFAAPGAGGPYGLALSIGGKVHRGSLGQLQPGWAFADALRVEPKALRLESKQWQPQDAGNPLTSSFVEKFSTYDTAPDPGANTKGTGGTK